MVILKDSQAPEYEIIKYLDVATIYSYTLVSKSCNRVIHELSIDKLLVGKSIDFAGLKLLHKLLGDDGIHNQLGRWKYHNVNILYYEDGVEEYILAHNLFSIYEEAKAVGYMETNRESNDKNMLMYAVRQGKIKYLRWMTMFNKLDVNLLNTSLILELLNAGQRKMAKYLSTRLNNFYYDDLVSKVIECGDLKFAKWLIDEPDDHLITKSGIIDPITKIGSIDVFEWLTNAIEIDSVVVCTILSKLSSYENLAGLDWWLDTYYTLNINDKLHISNFDALDEATMEGYISVLKWWEFSGIDLMISKKTIMNLRHYRNRKDVLLWWRSYFNSRNIRVFDDYLLV